ncbi:MAG TPA: PilZ domain-containing protein [Micropepsaceae bacterium]|nr:PilZ domain-containing protein [Micropepsaceae bacterium]
MSTPIFAPPPRVVDERRAARKRTLLSGKVIYGEDNRVRDCTIRDLSQSGARIALARGEVIPTRVFLIDRRSASLYEARVTWIKAPDFGLTFMNAYSLDRELPPELRHLEQVWARFRSPLGNIA